MLLRELTACTLNPQIEVGPSVSHDSQLVKEHYKSITYVCRINSYTITMYTVIVSYQLLLPIWEEGGELEA